MIFRDFFKYKMEMYDQLEQTKSYLKSVSVFYSMYGVALAVLNLKDSNYLKKCRLWRRLVSSSSDENKRRYYNKLAFFIQSDIGIIFQAQEFLQRQSQESININDSAERSGAVAIALSDFELNLEE